MGPGQAPPSGGFNPQQYDFITNPGKPAKGSLFGSGKQRILYLVIGGLVILTILIIVLSLVFGGKGGASDQLVSIAKQQTELIRVAGIGVDKAGGEETKGFAVTVELSMTTQQNNLIDYLKKNGKKVSTKELATGKDSETDTTLTNAETNGRFDDVFINVIGEQLKSYQSSLEKTYDSISNQKAKQLLAEDYDQVKTLLGEN